MAVSGASDYAKLLSELRSRIHRARVGAHVAVNRERTLLYWDIGRAIDARQKAEGWGAAVIPRLSKDLAREFPEMSGISERNLKRMIAFYRAYPGLDEIVPQAAAQLATNSETRKKGKAVPQAAAQMDERSEMESLLRVPWFHNVVLLEKTKDRMTRFWYAAQASEHGWSRAVLTHQIESELHLRAENRSNNFATALPEPQSDLAQELVKDSYNLGFLDVRKSLHERELEDRLIANLRDFLLELGFAFIGSQYRLEVAGQE